MYITPNVALIHPCSMVKAIGISESTVKWQRVGRMEGLLLEEDEEKLAEIVASPTTKK